MSWSVRIGRIFGIPIYIHFSWLIAFGLVTFLLSQAPFMSMHDHEWSWWGRIVAGVVTGLLFFASVIAHELAHSRIAIRNGIPVKGITLFVLGGVAHISREVTSPNAEFKMAMAGPLCSLVLAVAILLGGVIVFGDLNEEDLNNPVFWLTLCLVVMNLMLVVLNLIPGYPLDGGRMLRAVLWWGTGNYRRATHISSLMGRGIAYSLIACGIGVMLIAATDQTSNADDVFAPFGLWLAFMGWFLQGAASTSYHQAKTRHALEMLNAAEVVDVDCPHPLAPSATVQNLVQDYVALTGYRHCPVVEDGRLVGVVNLSDIKSIQQQYWRVSSLEGIMTRPSELMMIRREVSALSALERMDEHGMSQVFVMDGSNILGVISRDGLFRCAQAKVAGK